MQGRLTPLKLWVLLAEQADSKGKLEITEFEELTQIADSHRQSIYNGLWKLEKMGYIEWLRGNWQKPTVITVKPWQDPIQQTT